MNLFSRLREKPWENTGLVADTAAIGYAPTALPARVALRFLLAVVSVLFFLIIVTFLSRSQLGDFQALAGEPWQPFTNPTQLWLNTLVLLASSICIQLAAHGAGSKRSLTAVCATGAALLFAALFLIGQFVVWRQLVELGYYVSRNPANSYFYLFTGVHGAHLLGGLVALGIVSARVLRGGAIETLHSGLSLCATYWHFLFALWLLLFALLTSTPETYATIARLCGF